MITKRRSDQFIKHINRDPQIGKTQFSHAQTERSFVEQLANGAIRLRASARGDNGIFRLFRGTAISIGIFNAIRMAQ